MIIFGCSGTLSMYYMDKKKDETKKIEVLNYKNRD